MESCPEDGRQAKVKTSERMLLIFLNDMMTTGHDMSFLQICIDFSKKKKVRLIFSLEYFLEPIPVECARAV